MSDTPEDRLRKENRTLRARVKQLEAILLCTVCGHLRSEHDGGDSPCYGGREGLKPGEGDYCMCVGFESEDE